MGRGHTHTIGTIYKIAKLLGVRHRAQGTLLSAHTKWEEIHAKKALYKLQADS